MPEGKKFNSNLRDVSFDRTVEPSSQKSRPGQYLVRLQADNPDKATLFYVVDWLPPDFGAVGQYAVIFARELAQAGRHVVLVGLTSGKGHTSHEVVPKGGTLEIKWLRTKRYNKSGLVSRLIWSISTNIMLVTDVIRDSRSRNAEVLFTGAPPFMMFFAFFAKWLRGARLIYRTTDFYPEVLTAALGRRSLVLGVLQQITWYFRRRVDILQVLGEDQRQLLLAGGIAPDRITLKRDVAPVLISGTEKPAPRPPELVNRKVLLYSGNFGVAHEIDTIVKGLIHHERDGSGSFRLWLNASGSGVESVVKQLRIAHVPFARTEPVMLDRLPALLAAADAHLITLRSSFSGVVLPSKIYGCLCSGRPILFVGPKSSDVHLLCTQVSGLAYERVEPGDFAGFAEALERLTGKKRRQQFGQ
jgi:glycosyltransferase involved in cell wall biosynthesis